MGRMKEALKFVGRKLLFLALLFFYLLLAGILSALFPTYSFYDAVALFALLIAVQLELDTITRPQPKDGPAKSLQERET